MELSSIIGIIIGIASVIIAMIFKGTSVLVLLNPAALFIIFAGTIACILIAFPGHEVKKIPQLLKVIFFKQSTPNIEELIERFVQLSTLARQEGILAIESEVDDVEDPFLKQGLKMVIDGMEPDFIRDTMEEELDAIEERHAVGASIFTQAGTYAPTLGVLGAVLGLIAALGNLNDIDLLGQAIAAAFVATLFGIFTGYVMWHPFANKLKRKSILEVQVKSLMIEGVLSIQSGVAPRAMKDKLIVFIPHSERAKLDNAEGQGDNING